MSVASELLSKQQSNNNQQPTKPTPSSVAANNYQQSFKETHEIHAEQQSAVEGFTPNPNYDLSDNNTESALHNGLSDWINSLKQSWDSTQKSAYEYKKYNAEDQLYKNKKAKEVLQNLINEDPNNKDQYLQRLDEVNKLDEEASKNIKDFQESIQTNINEIESEQVSKIYKLKQALSNNKGADKSYGEALEYTLSSGIGSMGSMMVQQLAATFGREAIKKISTAAITGATEGLLGGPAAEVTVPITSAIATLSQIGLLLNARYGETQSELGDAVGQARHGLTDKWLKEHPNQQLDQNTIDEINHQAMKGTDQQFWTNMSLVALDAGELVLGSSLFKGSTLLKGLEKAGTYNKYTRLGKALGTGYLETIGEKAEEGIQYAAQKRQYDTALNLNQYEDKGFIKNILTDASDTLDSINYGLPYQKDLNFGGKYAKDKDFQESTEAGGLLGAIGGSISVGTKIYKDVSQLISTTRDLQNTGIANPDDKIFKLKDQIYLKHFTNDKIEFLLEGVRNLKDQKDDKGIPLMSNKDANTEIKNIVDAYEKYKEVNEHIENIESKGFLGIKKTPEQNLMLSILKTDLFHTSMQLVRDKENIKHIENYENINNLIDHQQTIVDQIRSTKDNSALEKTYNLKERLKLAENKLKNLKNTKKEFINDLLVTNEDLGKQFVSIEESNKNKESLIAELNINQTKEEYAKLLKIKDNKSLEEWFTKEKLKDKKEKEEVIDKETNKQSTISKETLEDKKTDIEKSRQEELGKLSTLQQKSETTGEIPTNEQGEGIKVSEEIKKVNAKYDKQLKDIEKNTISNESNTETFDNTINEDPNDVNNTSTTGSTDNIIGTAKKTSEYTTEAGLDINNQAPQAIRFYNAVRKLNLTNAKYKLKIVTRSNNEKLYNTILDEEKSLDPKVKEFDEKNPGYKGIYTLLVDKDGRPVLEDDKLVYSTLSSSKRINNGDIIIKEPRNSKVVAKELDEFRDKLKSITNPETFLNITSKSDGFINTEPTINGLRQSKSVIGKLVDNQKDIKNLVLELPTIRVTDSNRVRLSDGKSFGFVGKLYTKYENKYVDLIPRLLNTQEIDKVTELILARLQGIDGVSEEIDKIIRFGIGENPNQYSIGVAKGDKNLTLGETKWDGNIDTLKAFLATKYVNVNKLYLKSTDKFIDIFDTVHNTYNDYLLDGDNPKFGTDIVDKLNLEGQFKQQYLHYDPSIKENTLEDNNIPEGAHKFHTIIIGGVGATPIIGHGEDTATAKEVENGIEYTKLTKLGIAEAKQIGKYAKETNKKLIITSPIARAVETATIASKEANIKYKISNNLSAWNVGDYENKIDGSFNEKYYTLNPEEKAPNGESFNSFKDRMEKAYQEAYKLTDKDLMIAHSKVLRALEALDATEGKWTDNTTSLFLNENDYYDVESVPELKQEITKPKIGGFEIDESQLNDDTLNRLKSITSDTTLISKEEKEWFTTNFPNVPLTIVKGLIEQKALGQFISSGKVLLSDQATTGTLRHEAFHTVTQLYLNKQELDKLYNEAKEKTGVTDRLYLEEAMAEDFIQYSNTGKILNNRIVRNTIFKRLLNFIKDLLKLDASSIEDIYRRIDKGFYRNANIIGNRQFNKLNKIEGLSETTSKDVLDGIDAIFFDILFNNNKIPSDINEELAEKITTKIKNKLSKLNNDLYDKYKKSPNDNDYNTLVNYHYIIGNWNNVIKQWQARSKAIGIDIKIDNEIDLNEDQDKESKDRDSAFQEANTIATKSTMSLSSKMLIRSLKQKNKDGSDKINTVGLPTIVNFNTTYNYLLKSLSGLSTYEEIYNKIDQLANNKPELIDLLERLGEPNSNVSGDKIIFQQQFRQDFAKNKNTSWATVLKDDGNIYHIDLNKQVSSDRVKDKWRNIVKNEAKQSVDGKLTINPDLLKLVKEDKLNSIDFLNSLGFILSDEAKLASKDSKEFNNAVNSIKQYINKQEGDITELFTDKSDVTGNIATLTDLESNSNPDVTELSFLSGTGKTVYSIGQNNELSIIKNKINNVKNKSELFEQLPHLNTVTAEGSVYLDELFYEEGDKKKDILLNVDLKDTVKTDSSIKGKNKFAKATKDISKGDKYVQEIMDILLSGRSAYLRASDKASEHTPYITKNGKSTPIISIDTLKSDYNNEKLHSIFNNYFKSELKRIALFTIKNVGKDIDQYNNKGDKWSIFSNMISKSLKDKIEESISATELKLLTIDELKSRIDSIAPQFYEDINKELFEGDKAFFNKYSIEIKNQLSKYQIEIGKGISKDLNKYSIDQITRSIAVNDMINSIEQIKLFLGDMTFYKDLYKRTAMNVGTKETASTDTYLNDFLNNDNKRLDYKIADGNINVSVFEDVEIQSQYIDEYIQALKDAGIKQNEAKEILKSYNEIVEGDAQGWITLDEYREFNIRMGSWDFNKQEKAYEKAQKGEILLPSELVLFTVKKAQYAGPQSYNDIFVPAYHKYSLLPLIPSMVKGRNLEKLLNNMTKQQVGYALFKSGSKVGTKINNEGKANRFYTDTISGEVNTSDLQIQKISYNFLGLQTKTSDPHDEVIFGTQFRKLLFSNLFESGKSIDQVSNSQSLLDEYNKLIKEQIEESKSKLIKELGLDKDNYSVKDITKLVKKLQEESDKRNLADNIKESLQTEIVGVNIDLKYKFDQTVIKSKIDSMLTSLVNSQLIRQKTNGDAMIQVASSGFETIGKRDIGTNDSLKFYTKEQPWMEVMIPMSKNFKDLLAQYGIIDNINKAIANNEIDNKILTMIGYRIPTQGMNSIDHMRIKQFLPEEASTSIVLPSAIVAKSGGDYDVDKLNIFRPNIEFRNNKAQYKSNNNQNRIIEIASEIISHPHNFTQLITPNSTKILTNIVDDIRFIDHINEKGLSYEINSQEYLKDKSEYIKKFNANLKNIQYTDQIKITNKIEQFYKFLLAKDMIGIAAVHNTHNIIAQMKGLTLNKEYKVNEKLWDNDLEEFISQIVNKEVNINLKYNEVNNKLDLSKIKDASGNYNISEVISQIINATVDAAKDPFMFDINMTKETLGTYLYLIRIGVPFDTVAMFMKQPIISEYLEAKSINDGGYLKAVNKRISNKELLNKVRYKYLQAFTKEEQQSEAIDKQLDKDLLQSYLLGKNQDPMDKTYNKNQLQVLRDYINYSEQAQELGKGMRATNMDTSGMGKNLDVINTKLKDIQAVKATGFVNGIDEVLNDSIITPFNQSQFTLDAFSQFYNTQTPEIRENTQYLLDKLINETNLKGSDNINKTTSLIVDDFINYVIQNYGYINTKELQDKLFKTDSIAKKILAIKSSTNELKNNLFIKELYPMLAEGKRSTDNLKVYMKRYDAFTANQLTESFREFKEKDPLLAKEVMDAGILQSGLTNSPVTFMSLIPYEYYNDLAKSAFDNYNKKNGVANISEFNDMFLRENPYAPQSTKIWGKDYITKPNKVYKLQSDIEGIDYMSDDEIPSSAYIDTDKNVIAIPLKGNEDIYNHYNLLNDKDQIKTLPNNEVTTKWLKTLNTANTPYTFRLRKTTGGLKVLIFDKGQSVANVEDLEEAPTLHDVYSKYIYTNEKLSTTSILNIILNNLENQPIFTKLAQTLLDIQNKNKTVAVKVLDKFSDKLLEDNKFDIKDGKPAAFWNPRDNTIYLSKEVIDNHTEGNFQKVFLHEMIHSYTSYSIHKTEDTRTDIEKEFVKIITDLYNQAKDLSKNKDMYGFKNIEEFMAETMSSKKFNDELKSLDNLSIWKKLINAITKFLTGNEYYKDIKDEATKTIYEYLDNIDKINPGRNLVMESRASIDEEEKVVSPADSEFKKQYVFFKREVTKLQKEQSIYNTGSIEWNKVQEKIDTLVPRFNEAVKQNSREIYIELGTETLDKIENDIIIRLETDNLTATEKNIEYAADVLDTFADDEDLGGRSKKLYKRLFPFINKYRNDQINEFSTEVGGVTEEMINKQNTDINRFRAGTGALIDLSNYIARTIGLIIKKAQNAVETANKQLVSKIQTEVDLIQNWSKKNGVAVKDTYKIFIQLHKGSTKLTSPYFEDGTENPNYEKIQKDPNLKRFYDFYQSSIDDMQKYLPIKYGKNFIPNINKRSVVEVLKNLVPKHYTDEKGLILSESLDADIIPTEFTRKLSPDKKSTDLGSILLEFGQYANNHDEMTNILPKVRLLQRSMNDQYNSTGGISKKKYIKSSDPKKSVEFPETNLYKMVDTIIDMQVMGNMKKAEGKFLEKDILDEKGNKIGTEHVLASDIADIALKYNSLLRIGFSPIGAVTNVIFGDLSNAIEAIGSRFMTVSGLTSASKIFTQQTFNKNSILNKLLVQLNPLQELDDYQHISDISLKSKMSTEKLEEYMYSMQKAGEKWLQSRTMLAVMIKDGLLTSNGELTEKFNKLSDKEKSQLTDKIQRLNQMIHGRYSQKEAAALQQNVIYRLVSQFRKWIPAYVESRLGAEQFDVRLGVIMKGRYKSLFSSQVWKDMLSGKELSELDSYNMKKNLTELIMLGATTLLFVGLKGSDDDKRRRKNPAYKLAMTLLNRAAGDLEFFYSPQSAIDITSKVIPLSTTANTVLQAFKYIPTVMGETTHSKQLNAYIPFFKFGKSKYDNGSRKDRYKELSTLERLTPGAKFIDELSRISNQQQLEELNK